jgi:hypothetical protein
VAEPDLLKTAAGEPGPQYENDAGTGHESLGGRNRAAYATLKDALGTVLNPATQETLANLLTELQAHSQGTSVDPVVSQLSGRSAVQHIITEDLAKRDTATITSDWFDVTGRELKRVTVFTTLDQGFDIRTRWRPHAAGTARAAGGTAPIGVSAGWLIRKETDTTLTGLGVIAGELSLELTFATAPTTGIVTVVLELL